MIFLIQFQSSIFGNSDNYISNIRQSNEDSDNHGLNADNAFRYNILLVVGNSAELNRSEQQIQARLESNGYHLLIINDTLEKDELNGIDLIIVSKTVNSKSVGTRYKNVTCGFMTWEDNLQMRQFMGFSNNDGSGGTAWHSKNQTWNVLSSAPNYLRAGITGEVAVFKEADEMTYSPNESTVPKSATVVAELYPGDYHKTYYVFEKGSILGDGSVAKGRRIYFGLYDDTFRTLNDNGLKLFDAAVVWGCQKI
jgi:large repetitive protein